MIAERYVYMLHDLHSLHLDPAAGKFAAVLSGHTHVPNFYGKRACCTQSRLVRPKGSGCR